MSEPRYTARKGTSASRKSGATYDRRMHSPPQLSRLPRRSEDLTEAHLRLGTSASSFGHTEAQRNGFCEIIRHPSRIRGLILHSVAGDMWVAARSSLILFPLAFNNPQQESEFRSVLNERTINRLSITGVFMASTVIVWWVMGTVCFARNYMLSDAYINTSWQIVCIINTFVFFGLAVSPKIKRLREKCVFLLYTTFLWCAFSFWAWCSFVSIYAKQQKGDSEDYHTVRPVAHLKAFAGAISSVLSVTVIVFVDLFTDSITKHSLTFHLLILIGIAASRIAADFAHSDPVMKLSAKLDAVLLTLLYLVAYFARWFRELQDRSVLVRLKESTNRLQKVREAQKKKRRRRTQSAAEELLDLLDNCRVVIGERTKEFESLGIPTTSLVEADKYIVECCDRLTTADPERTADKAPEKTQQDESAMAEEAFINMYKVGRVIRGVKEEAEADRKGRQRKQSGVRFGTTITTQTFEVPSATADSMAGGDKYFVLSLSGVQIPLPILHTQIGMLVGKDYSLRILDFAMRSENILMEVGAILLTPYESYLECEKSVLLGFLHGCEKLYWKNNAFHNNIHAANVAHAGVAIMHMMELSSVCLELERAAFIIAALGHDIGHPGRTSSFYVSGNSVLALAQNDMAVLESFHSVILQQILVNSEDTGLLAMLSADETRTMRRLIIQFILALDMSKHFEIVSKSRVRRMSPDFNIDKEDLDRQMVLGLVFKAADVSYTTCDWGQHLEWALRLSEEMYQQGDEEKKMGLPVSPMCERADHKTFAKTQAGYMIFVITPLISELMEIDRTSSVGLELMTKLLFNKQKWDILREAKRTEQIPSTILQMKSAPVSWTGFCLAKATTAAGYKDLLLTSEVPVNLINRI